MNYLRSWFPDLGSYQAFNNRLNRISGGMNTFVEGLLTHFRSEGCSPNQSLLDSRSIITCSGKNQGKVVKEINGKGYCSTKSMCYYGMKLHALGYRNVGGLLYPEQILFTPASVNDLSLLQRGMVENEEPYLL